MIKKITLLAVAIVAAFSANATLKLYVNTPDGAAPYVYTWAPEIAGWPGLEMTQTIQKDGKTWHYVVLNDIDDKDGVAGLVLSAGLDDGYQSADFVGVYEEGWYIINDWFEEDRDAYATDVTAQYYTRTPQDQPDQPAPEVYDLEKLPTDLPVYEGETFCYVINDASWDKMNVWAWGGDGNLYSAWPGLAIEKAGKDGYGFDVYLWKKDASLPDPANIIFSKNGNPQTADLEFQNGGIYRIGPKASKACGEFLKIYEPAPGPEPGIPGDVNGDESVNSGDVSAVYNVMLGAETDEAIIKRADVNADETVNSADVSAVYGIMMAE